MDWFAMFFTLILHRIPFNTAYDPRKTAPKNLFCIVYKLLAYNRRVYNVMYV